MIKELVVENIAAGKESDEIKKIVGPEEQGKILKVFVRFSEEERFGAQLKILTREGEEILNIDSKNEKRGLYYPRVSVDSRKYGENAMGSENQDYFYFLNGLLVSIKMDDPNFEGKVLEKIRIVYEVV